MVPAAVCVLCESSLRERGERPAGPACVRRGGIMVALRLLVGLCLDGAGHTCASHARRCQALARSNGSAPRETYFSLGTRRRALGGFQRGVATLDAGDAVRFRWRPAV